MKKDIFSVRRKTIRTTIHRLWDQLNEKLAFCVVYLTEIRRSKMIPDQPLFMNEIIQAISATPKQRAIIASTKLYLFYAYEPTRLNFSKLFSS